MKRLKQLLDTGLRFFPLQLLFLHFKKSHLLLILWVFLFGFVTQTLGSKFGFPYLFLTPEYLGSVNWLSYFILGFSIGGFFMAYHLYSYVILGPSFPFIATLARPFFKFSVNNSLIPTIFYFVLVWNIVDIQAYEELRSGSEVLIDILSLTAGIITFILISVYYFFKTNFDILNFQTRSKRKGWYSLVGTLFSKKNYWFESHMTRAYQPSYYFSHLYRLKMARQARHYDRTLTKEIFRQNHLNASVFEMVMLISFLVLGIFQNYPVIQIPSGASYILLSTLVLMVMTILTSWFKGWAISIFILTVIAINLISTHTDVLNPENKMYGLDNSSEVRYDLNHLHGIQFDEARNQSDLENQIKILENWHQKASKLQGTDKPRLILVNTSGGGLRSAMWTFHVFAELDESMKGQFFPNVHLITGASGGMIGASYYRELYRVDPDFQASGKQQYLDNISKDLLNSVCFNLATHDVLFRSRSVEVDGVEYVRDRGYAFERQLHENTGFVMDNRLGDYEVAEFRSSIPLMIYSPTIINDGRRMIISTQPMGFLNGTERNLSEVGPENVEYIKLFSDQQPMNTRYSSVMRASSTFPIVLPMISLPTKPAIQLMDAGIRDNYGTKTTVRYISAIEDWLEENTSGVVVVQVRDISRDYDISVDTEPSVLDHVTRPILNFYSNYHHAQEYNAQELIESSACDGVPVDVVTFVLRQDPTEKISLSWHLTQREKNDIQRTFQNERNQKEVKKLIDLLR